MRLSSFRTPDKDVFILRFCVSLFVLVHLPLIHTNYNCAATAAAVPTRENTDTPASLTQADKISTSQEPPQNQSPASSNSHSELDKRGLDTTIDVNWVKCGSIHHVISVMDPEPIHYPNASEVYGGPRVEMRPDFLREWMVDDADLVEYWVGDQIEECETCICDELGDFHPGPQCGWKQLQICEAWFDCQCLRHYEPERHVRNTKFAARVSDEVWDRVRAIRGPRYEMGDEETDGQLWNYQYDIHDEPRPIGDWSSYKHKGVMVSDSKEPYYLEGPNARMPRKWQWVNPNSLWKYSIGPSVYLTNSVFNRGYGSLRGSRLHTDLKRGIDASPDDTHTAGADAAEPARKEQ
ncbi:hypothetical protein TWF696_000641 [Orbilia brochopaga]|uniref:Uncharacterized protein n=1 Tax=Orbilia brochopaga TaxID=3140254 RepID=A0AAV9VI90_9PEZI